MGYRRHVVLLGAGDSAHVDVRLGRLATLATVSINEREHVRALRLEIEARVIAGHGYITDSTRLARMGATHRAFEVPHVRVQARGTSFTVQVRRVSLGVGPTWCTPQFYIDDSPADAEQLAVHPKENIALIEFYTRESNAPLKYTGSGTGTSGMGTCGVILIWTKQFMRAADVAAKAPAKKP